MLKFHKLILKVFNYKLSITILCIILIGSLIFLGYKNTTEIIKLKENQQITIEIIELQSFRIYNIEIKLEALMIYIAKLEDELGHKNSI